MAIPVNSSNFTPPQNLKVAYNPDVSTKYCGYNPNTYHLEVFVKGIFRDLYLGAITYLINSKQYSYVSVFLKTGDMKDRLGDAERRIEFGKFFVEPYHDIDRADQSLAPVSGHHINIITETDRTIEKWQVRVGYNREDFANYFYDYSTFTLFMDALKGNMINAVKEALSVIVRAVTTANPSHTSIDDREMARIFGKTWDNRPVLNKGPKTPQNNKPDQLVGQKYNEFLKGLIIKYASKARNLWKNITHYNPYNFSFENKYEAMRKGFIYGLKDDKGNIITSDKDLLRVQTQQLYTDTHKSSVDGGREDKNTTSRITDLHRNDCLFALFDAISKAVNVITSEKSTEFWLGDDTALKIYENPETFAAWQKKLLLGQGLDGHAVGSGISTESLSKNYAENLSRSDADGFEVMSTPEDLVLFLNPEDYMDLEMGIGRRGQMDTRTLNLDALRKYVSNIYPMRGMAPGFARLMDKRAFTITNYFQMTDTASPQEYQNWRHKLFFFWTCNMFSLFAGTLFVPTPHFIASPRFYDKYGLIGQLIEDKQE